MVYCTTRNSVVIDLEMYLDERGREGEGRREGGRERERGGERG